MKTPILDKIEAIAKKHKGEEGAVVLGVVEYHQLWKEMPEEEKQQIRHGRSHGYAMMSVRVGHRDYAPVLQWDKETSPRWASKEDCDKHEAQMLAAPASTFRQVPLK